MSWILCSHVTAKGNSGTWVVDARNGDLFGHIIAGHPKSTIAYMLSAETIFSQLEKVFGGKFDLPTTEPSIADSSTIATPAPAIDVASTDPNQADIDSTSAPPHLTVRHCIHGGRRKNCPQMPARAPDSSGFVLLTLKGSEG